MPSRTFGASTHTVEYTSNIAATTAMSFCAWVKNPSVAGTTCKMLACQEDQWRVSFNAEKYGGGTAAAGALFFGRSCATTDQLSEVQSPGATWANWNHVAVTFDGAPVTNAAKFYLNGVLLTNSATRNGAGAIDNATGNPNVGNDNAHTLSCLASISHACFHNVVLSVGEVNQSMSFGYTPRGLYVYWPLGYASPEPDLSGLARVGTVTSATISDAGPPIRAGFFGFRPYKEQLAVVVAPPSTTNFLTCLGVGA